MPCNPRLRLRTSGVLASPHSSEAKVKSTRPPTKTRLRPIRSLSEPAVSRMAASVRA